MIFAANGLSILAYFAGGNKTSQMYESNDYGKGLLSFLRNLESAYQQIFSIQPGYRGQQRQ
jgi:hypothetical protein